MDFNDTPQWFIDFLETDSIVSQICSERLVEIPYSGEPRKAKLFLSTLESRFGGDWSDLHKVACLLSHVASPVLEVVSAYVRATTEPAALCYGIVRNKVIRMFEGGHLKFESELQLLSLKYELGDSLKQFLHRFGILRARVSFEDKHLLPIFYNALDRRLIPLIGGLKSRTATLDQLIKELGVVADNEDAASCCKAQPQNHEYNFWFRDGWKGALMADVSLSRLHLNNPILEPLSELELKLQCSVCRGHGHRMDECGTRSRRLSNIPLKSRASRGAVISSAAAAVALVVASPETKRKSSNSGAATSSVSATAAAPTASHGTSQSAKSEDREQQRQCLPALQGGGSRKSRQTYYEISQITTPVSQRLRMFVNAIPHMSEPEAKIGHDLAAAVAALESCSNGLHILSCLMNFAVEELEGNTQ